MPHRCGPCLKPLSFGFSGFTPTIPLGGSNRMPTMTAASSLSLPGLQPCGLAWDGEAWWHSDGTAHRVYRLDPADGAVRREYEVRGAMGGTAWGDGHVWQAIPAENRVAKLDPWSGEVVHALSLRLSVVGV